MNDIKRWIINCLPYGLVEKRRNSIRERKGTFIKDYLHYVISPQPMVLKQSLFKQIVSVNGFGYSGSGAVIDILREFDNVNVLGIVDEEGSKASKSVTSYLQEQDFLRLSGGLFELEKYVQSSNIFHCAAALLRFTKVVEKSTLYRHNQEVRDCFYSFYKEITSINTTVSHPFYNSYLYDWNRPHVISYMRDMTIEEYRSRCQILITNITNVIHTENPTDFLVMDQFVNDFEFDVDRYLDYIPNFKMIHVYRDPRDIYCFAVEKNIEWIPHMNVDDFIVWYGLLTNKFDMNSDKYLVVRFEDLIYDYQYQLERIMNFVGIKQNRQRRNAYFDPSISVGGVGIWKKSQIKVGVFNQILKSLPQFCYNK